MQEINDNKVLSTVLSMLINYSKVANTDFKITDKTVLVDYIKHIRNNTLLMLVTLALINEKLQSDDELDINQKVAETLTRTLEEQTKKGLEKYLNTVNPGDFDASGWIKHAIEELVDTTVYETCLIEVLANDTTATAKKTTT